MTRSDPLTGIRRQPKDGDWASGERDNGGISSPKGGVRAGKRQFACIRCLDAIFLQVKFLTLYWFTAQYSRNYFRSTAFKREGFGSGVQLAETGPIALEYISSDG